MAILTFSNDTPNLFFFVVDKSSSMSSSSEDVEQGMEMFRKSFENFEEADSIGICISQFSDDYKSGYFTKVKDFSFCYYTMGCTALCYSICKGAEDFMEYMAEEMAENNVRPRGTFIVFSDGEPCGDPYNSRDAIIAVEKLNNAGITTVFVAFGDAISSNWGKKHRFQAQISVDKESDSLQEFMGVTLSQSCKQQSQSVRALGADFFSQADNSSSASYSMRTEAVLEEEDWFDDI